jgi:hypothetical protein
MKSILAGLGAVVLVLSILSMFGVGDFRICYGPHGYCERTK